MLEAVVSAALQRHAAKSVAAAPSVPTAAPAPTSRPGLQPDSPDSEPSQPAPAPRPTQSVPRPTGLAEFARGARPKPAAAAAEPTLRLAKVQPEQHQPPSGHREPPKLWLVTSGELVRLTDARASTRVG